MGEAKHTPGPWLVGPGDIYAAGTASSDHDDIVIAAVGRAGLRSHEYAIIKAHKPEGMANSRLIAAAPELLAAAQKALNFIQNTESEIGDTLDSGDMLRSAIAKATGETP